MPSSDSTGASVPDTLLNEGNNEGGVGAGVLGEDPEDEVGDEAPESPNGLKTEGAPVGEGLSCEAFAGPAEDPASPSDLWLSFPDTPKGEKDEKNENTDSFSAGGEGVVVLGAEEKEKIESPEGAVERDDDGSRAGHAADTEKAEGETCGVFSCSSHQVPIGFS